MAKHVGDQNSASTFSDLKETWKWIWKLQVLTKVKLFMWKCLAKALPARMALRRRSIKVDGICPRYGSRRNNIMSFKDCRWVIFFWRYSNVEMVFKQTWLEVIQGINYEFQRLFCYIPLGYMVCSKSPCFPRKWIWLISNMMLLLRIYHRIEFRRWLQKTKQELSNTITQE